MTSQFNTMAATAFLILISYDLHHFAAASSFISSPVTAQRSTSRKGGEGISIEQAAVWVIGHRGQAVTVSEVIGPALSDRTLATYSKEEIMEICRWYKHNLNPSEKMAISCHTGY